MITENDIRLALKKALVEIDINEIDHIQIHVNPEDRYSYIASLTTVNRSGRYTYNAHPLIANEHIPVGEIHVGVFFRKP